jgi:UDP-glucose 4-epimerase
MKKKYLITGGSGFIGKHLLRKLSIERDVYVYAIDKKHSNFTANNIEFIKKDLKTCKTFPIVDVVIHLAAYNGTRFFYEEPLNVIKDNIISTINLVDFYRKQKLENFIYAGSPESIAGATSLFGMEMPCTESYPYVFDLNRRWSYGMSKALGELYVSSADWKYKIIRYFNVYGPEQVEHFIPDFIQSIINKKPKLTGHQNTRSFLYIDDAIDATMKIIQNDKIQNEIINVGGGREISILNVAKKIMKIMKCKEELILEDHPIGSVLRRCPNIHKLKNICNFVPHTNLQKGLTKTIKSYI